MSLRARLLLALLAVVAAGLLASGAATFVALRSFLYERVDGQLHEARTPVAMALAAAGETGMGHVPFATGGGPGRTALPPGTFGQLRDADGEVLATVTFVYGDRDLATPRLPETLPAAAGAGTVLTVPAEGGGPGFRLLVQALPASGRVLLVAVPLTEVAGTLRRLVLVEVLVSVLALAALAAAAWAIVRRGLRPLERMAATADAITAGDLSRRVEPADRRTEVGRLGASLNTMLDRIERAFAERRRSEERLRSFLADASHELRTPLTTVRGYAELFPRGLRDDPEALEAAMRRIADESRRMAAMVEEMLTVARLGEGRESERAPVDLAALVADAVLDARALQPDRPLTVEAPERLVVAGDDHRLRQVVANLLQNALRHTPADAPVRVSLREEGGEAVLAVADRGPGLAPEDAARVFEPFYRADASRSRATGGSGLGLAIVKAVVEAHGGSVALETAPGEGATFTVRLPLAPPTG